MMKTAIILTLIVQHVACFSTQFFSATSFTAGSIASISSMNTVLQTRVALSMSSTNDDTSQPRRRRRRKDGKNVEAKEDLEKVEEPSTMNVSTSKPEPVTVKVQDIRDLVAGKTPEETEEDDTKSQSIEQYDEDEDEDEDLDDDEEYEYYYEDEDKNEVIVGTSSTGDSSLEALLADAKRMRAKEAEENGEADGPSIPSAIKSVISTIVTIDFFVVCALLAWFLAGIFCSYVIKDDTVQIAFNGIFEPVVQPALGILMIGSAAGSAFQEPEKE